MMIYLICLMQIIWFFTCRCERLCRICLVGQILEQIQGRQHSLDHTRSGRDLPLKIYIMKWELSVDDLSDV